MLKRLYNSRGARFAATAITIIVGIALLVIAALGIYSYWRTTNLGDKQPYHDQVVTERGVVSEREPEPMNEKYSVSHVHPRAISLPSLQEEGYIQRVGTYENNEMAAPSNIHFAGWYTGSVIPGEKGLSIINGHAGGRYTDGIFRHLGKLAQGEELKVQMGDLKWRSFEVVSVRSYGVSESATPLFHDTTDIENELHLITCDGGFDDASKTYDKRLIVVAKRVN